jgi:SH3 domain-containing YSC84-like protein 1
MHRRTFVIAPAAISLAALPGIVLAEDEGKLIGAAQTTFSNFLRDPEMSWFQRNLNRARAVLISPEIVKAGFVLGGSGGRGVLVAKDPKGGWRGPVFYTLATASIGFQAGLQVSEMVTMVLTQKGLDSLMATSMKVGGDASIAAGPVGAGAKGEIVTDMVAFSRAKGLYGGLNLDGTAVSVDEKANNAFYGGSATPADVLIRGSVSSAKGQNLVAAVRGAAGRK